MTLLLGNFIFIFGLIVGSFLNVCALRFGFTETNRDRSACMACGAPLTWKDLVPLVSYVALRGTCRACGSRVSAQYPLVELATAVLFLMTFLSHAPVTVMAWVLTLALFGFWAAFILILVVDLRHTLVPLPFAWTLIGFAAVFGILVAPAASLLGGAVLAGLIGIIVFVTRGRGMGSGDIYIAGALGLLFGVGRGIEVLALSFWIGAVIGVLLILLKKGVTMKAELPFAPFLFIAALVGAFTAFSPFTWIASILYAVSH